jgi:uncharacterized protein (TIGR00369 family)
MESSIEFPPVDPSVRADLRVAIESMPASRWLGLRIIGFDPKGISRIDMDVRPEMTFDGVSVQGGLVGALADYAGVSAAVCTTPDGWRAATVGFEVHNIAPAAGERLVAIGRAVSVGRTVGVSRADVYALRDGVWTLVTIATTTARLFDAAGRG